MPGFVSLVSSVEREPLNQILAVMVKTMQRKQDNCIRTWNNKHTGLATTGPNAENALAEKDGTALALVGHIYEDERLNDRLAALPDLQGKQGKLACRLLNLYLGSGVEGLAGLNGAYAIAVWDGPAARMSMITDRYGLQPCYYWTDGQRIAFASEIKAIAAHPAFHKRVDPVGVFDLLAAEQMLGERTLYEGVQALPPASLLTFEDGRVKRDTYWLPEFHTPGDPALTETEAMDQFALRVQQAVERGLRSVPGGTLDLLLTGGLDSRLIAAALACARNDQTILASTIGHPHARDVRFGHEIARATGMEYNLIPADPAYVANFGAECVLRTEGNMNVHASWILGVSDFLHQSGVQAVMDGVGGESVSGRIWISEQGQTNPEAMLGLLTREYWNFPAAVSLMNRDMAAEAEHVNCQMLSESLRDALYENHVTRYDYFHYRQFYRHPTGNILSDDALVLEPLFDIDLLDFAFRLPPEMRSMGRLYKKMILHKFPTVAKAGYSDTDRPLTEAESSIQEQMARFIRRTRRRVTRRLGRRIPLLRFGPLGDDPGSAVYYNEWMRTASRPFIEKIIKQQSDALAPFVDIPRARQLVADHMEGRKDAFVTVGALVTLAQWMQVYL